MYGEARECPSPKSGGSYPNGDPTKQVRSWAQLGPHAGTVGAVGHADIRAAQR